MTDDGALLDTMRVVLSLCAVAIGLAIMAAGLGRIISAGDAYRRLHAAIAGQGWAFALIAFGLALADGRLAAFAGAAAVAALYGCAAPVLAHAGANAAHAAGLEPAPTAATPSERPPS